MSSSNMSAHTSIYVAPLHFHKDTTSRATSRSSDRPPSRSSASHSRSQSTMSRQNGQMTPPLTPSESSFERHDFQTYLRAFYPYHPSFEEGSSTQILPLNSGDLILVHSIHTNGWADGTLLISGARGWLPTNYCDGYDNEPVGNLLRALTAFWDLIKSSNDGGMTSFQHSDYVRGLVAGVRCMLVSSLPLAVEELVGLTAVLTSSEGASTVPQERVAIGQFAHWHSQEPQGITGRPFFICPNYQGAGKRFKEYIARRTCRI